MLSTVFLFSEMYWTIIEYTTDTFSTDTFSISGIKVEKVEQPRSATDNTAI